METLYTQTAAEALTAASVAVTAAIEAAEQAYRQLRDPGRPWQQTVMQLLDTHQALLTAVEKFETAAWNLRNERSGGTLTGDDVDLLLARQSTGRAWSETSDGDTRADAQRVIERHRARLAEVARFTAQPTH